MCVHTLATGTDHRVRTRRTHGYSRLNGHWVGDHSISFTLLSKKLRYRGPCGSTLPKFMETPTVLWLVVWLPFFIFPYIGFLIIPIDELIFFRGLAQPPTSSELSFMLLQHLVILWEDDVMWVAWWPTAIFHSDRRLWLAWLELAHAVSHRLRLSLSEKIGVMCFKQCHPPA